MQPTRAVLENLQIYLYQEQVGKKQIYLNVTDYCVVRGVKEAGRRVWLNIMYVHTSEISTIWCDRFTSQETFAYCWNIFHALEKA